MKWKTLQEEFPDYGDNVQFLTSDGKNVYVMYGDKEELWFISETNENEYTIRNRLTHWCFLKDVTLPNQPERLSEKTSLDQGSE